MSGFGKDVRTDLEGATARATFEPPPMLGCTDSSFYPSRSGSYGSEPLQLYGLATGFASSAVCFHRAGCSNCSLVEFLCGDGACLHKVVQPKK
jgi:hypothetical protein